MINEIKKIVVQTGELLLDLQKTKKIKGNWIGAQYKSNADIIAHNRIISLLNKSFPEINIVSEEDFKKNLTNNYNYFLVDPIDGTASYANGYSGYVVQICFMKDNKPCLCAIYAPYFEKL